MGDEDGVECVLRWTDGFQKPDYKITIQPNGEDWLVLLQRKLGDSWDVEKSWSAERKPTIGGDFERVVE